MLKFYTLRIKHHDVMLSFKEKQCTRSVFAVRVMRISVLQWIYLSDTFAKCSWFDI